MFLSYFLVFAFFLFAFSFIYKAGELVEGKPGFYNNNKGTMKGKTYFSLLFISACFGPILFVSSELWFLTITKTFALLSVFELIKSYSVSKKQLNNKLRLFFVLSVVLIYFSFVVITKNLGIFYSLVTISLCIISDLLFNVIGVKLSKLPDDYQWLRLKYPKSISGNKSFSAVIFTALLLTLSIVAYNFIVITIYIVADNYDYLDYLLTISFIFTVTIVFATAFGDAFFSILKRNLGIDDYYKLLGPIGGFLDRVDGWLFALPSAYYVQSYQKIIENYILSLFF